ncbi:hypothetical protein [Salinibaculum rarum]|uniref:hypothetical protein n=1 Tax=Salinibaculum rarum TaxID=3058903 RepID=UPI00265E7DA8|nr:hypothetical protein [Salinibaculum sp. KK48]
MDRRAFLATVGGAALAGCGGQATETPGVSVGDLDQLGATRRTCDADVANSGSITLDGRDVSLEGTVVGDAICAKPTGQLLTGSGTTDGTVTIVIEAAVPGSRECEECRTRIDYEGAVRLDNRPETVTLEHVTLDGGQTEVARATTLTVETEPTATQSQNEPTDNTTRDR